MHPLTQDILSSAARTYRPPDYEDSSSATMVASFRQRGLNPVVTVAALVEGFGPGWSAKEACQLALQALRNQFVQAEEEELDQVLRNGLVDANRAVYDRAVSYAAVGDIGGRMGVAVISGGDCLLAQVGGCQAYLILREDGFKQVEISLVPAADDFLGKSAELALVTLDTSRESLPLQADDTVVLVNRVLAAGLDPVSSSDSLSHLSLERAADKLIKMGQIKQSGELQAALLVEMPGAAKKAAAILPRPSRPVMWGAGALALLALLIWGGLNWFGRDEESLAVVTLSPSPTATIDLPPPPTDLPLLPTPMRSATPTPTSTHTPTLTLTPSPTPSPIPPTETRAPTETATPTETLTNTPVPPTATATLTPSPTIPAAPIVVGGQVVVVGTEGLGMSLRDGPGVGFDRLAIIYDGEVMEVIGGPDPVGNLIWWQVRTADGAEGWGVERYLQGVAAE